MPSWSVLYAKIDPQHEIDPDAQDFDQHEWYIDYFKKRKARNSHLFLAFA